ncbi:hypothetical protein, partial [Streptococcus mitis]|uniref:hypothetical protein n=1 Tax=Streptococcus mitis TaxID=28037 RepID=UPI0021B5227E
LQHTVAILVNGDLLRFRSAFVHDAAAAIVQHMTSIVAASLDTNAPLPTTTMHYRALPALHPFFAQLPASATMPHAVRSFLCAFV